MPRFLLIGSATLLGLIVLVELFYGSAQLEPAARPNGPAQAPVAAPGAVPTAPSDYPYITSRPLFDRSRSPTVGQEAISNSAAGPASSLPFALAGVVTTDGQKLALVQATGARDILHIGEGGSVLGWTVEEILSDRVIFRQGARTVAVPLRDQAAGVPRRQPARQINEATSNQ